MKGHRYGARCASECASASCGENISEARGRSSGYVVYGRRLKIAYSNVKMIRYGNGALPVASDCQRHSMAR